MTAAIAGTVVLPARPGVRFGRVLRSEWGKAWGLRSTRWAVVATIAVNGLMNLMTGLDSAVGAEGYGNSLAYLLGGGLLFAQLPLLVHGALTGAGEFATGSAASTLSAVPRRWPVLLAKALTVAGTAALATVASLAVSALILLTGPMGPDLHLALDDGQSVRILVGGTLAMVLLTVLALGVGALLRRSLVAVAVMFALGLSGLALMGADALSQWLPGHALLSVTASREFLDVVADIGSTVVGPWGSIGVLGAWVALVLVLAAIRLRRADV